MKKYIAPHIQVTIIDPEELLDMAPQSNGEISDTPNGDVKIDIDNSNTSSDWDDNDETL